MAMFTILLAALASLPLVLGAWHPTYTKPVPANHVVYDPQARGSPAGKFNSSDFNAWLYAKYPFEYPYVRIRPGTYRVSTPDAGFAHWNLHNMTLDFRNVTIWLPTRENDIYHFGPAGGWLGTAWSYWDVEGPLTIIGLTLWTTLDQWTQGTITQVNVAADGSTQVTVKNDAGYPPDYWTDGQLGGQPLIYMDAKNNYNHACANMSIASAANTSQPGVVTLNLNFWQFGAYKTCSGHDLAVGHRLAKASMHNLSLIVQEYSNITWIDCTSNMYWDSYGFSHPVYINNRLINSPPTAAMHTPKAYPPWIMVWGDSPTLYDWYYLGWHATGPNGRDPRPVNQGSVVQINADPNHLVPWW